jgi:hypothetical protein
MKKYLFALAAILTAARVYQKRAQRKLRHVVEDLGGDV